MVDLFRFRKWDLVSHRGIYYLLSGLMLLAGIVAFIMNWQKTGFGLNEGIDFRGGGLATYSLTGHIPDADDTTVVSAIRTKLDQAGVDNDVTISPGAKDQILVRVLLKKDAQEDQSINAMTQDQILADKMEKSITPAVQDAIKSYNVFPTENVQNNISRDAVDPSVSAQLKLEGLLALIIGSTLILFWIWFRYNIGGFGWKYGVAGILALLHDLGTLVGMFAILHYWLQVNSPFVAALLTVLGYSIHDTIVIFDRIRENMRLRKGRTFAETVNISLLETMARSVNTILTVLFTLLALFFFGGPTLRDFVAAMLIGVTVGGYSSIFIASQLLVSWAKEKDRVILPLDAPMPAPVVTAPRQPVAATVAAGTIPSAAPQAAPPIDKADALQRARQAGKTARRKR